MYSKSLLIAIAAFAVTTSGAQAFMGVNYLDKAGLSPQQTEAFTHARELRLQGKANAARDVLLAAGIDEKAVVSLRQAAREARQALETSIAQKDFAAFKLAVKGTPLADIITTKADFLHFSEAVALKQGGQHSEASDIFIKLGVKGHGPFGNHYGRGMQSDLALKLTSAQRDAFEVAKQANDKEIMQQILREAGLDLKVKHVGKIV